MGVSVQMRFGSVIHIFLHFFQNLTQPYRQLIDGYHDLLAGISADDYRLIQQKKEGVLDKAFELRDMLKGEYSIKVDDSDKSPGWKFSEQEIQGIPTRIEIGPKDIEKNQAVIVRRDTREKIVVSIDELPVRLGEVLEEMQKDMYDRAKAHLDANTHVAHNWDEFQDFLNTKQGFIRAMWCGDRACEEAIKEETGATTRCMPFEQEKHGDVCVHCGKPAKCEVYFGKAY